MRRVTVVKQASKQTSKLVCRVSYADGAYVLVRMCGGV